LAPPTANSDIKAKVVHGLPVSPGFVLWTAGYVTLEPDTEVLYKVSDYYSPQHEGGILWNDPGIGIDWTLAASEISLSERDRLLPRLDDLAAVF